jgi:hypothetical protein
MMAVPSYAKIFQSLDVERFGDVPEGAAAPANQETRNPSRRRAAKG